MSRRAPPPRQEKEVEATGRQVRRRLHTTTTSRRRRSTAFRERLVELDMAEARREIAAALRVHRAPSSAVPGVHNEKQQLLLPQIICRCCCRSSSRRHGCGLLLLVIWFLFPRVCCDGDDNKSFFSDHYSKYYCRGDRSLAPAPVALPAGGGDLDLDLEYHLACGIQLPARPLGLNLSLHGLVTGASVDDDDDDGKNNMWNGSFDHPWIIQAPQCAAAVSDSKALSSPSPAWMPAMASVDEINYDAPSSVPPAAHANPVPEREAASLAGVEWGDGTADVAACWWSMEDGCGRGKLGAPVADAQEGGGAIAVPDDAGWLQNDNGGPGDQEGVIVAGSGTPDGGNLETFLDDGFGAGGDYYCWRPQGEGDAEDITLPCMEIGEMKDGTANGSHDR